MTITLNEHASTEGILPAAAATDTNNPAWSLPTPGKQTTHHPKAGLNPLADAASALFTAIGNLKQTKTCQWATLQNELIQTVIAFQETITKLGYQPEYVIVCRYIMCATIDDIISNTTWGNQGQWEPYALIPALNQEGAREDKFFSILERAIAEPAHYIDLMELMYLCLSLGYQGHYRATNHHQHQLEQITHALYKHIRAYRGGFSKMLSPAPLKTVKTRGLRLADHRLPTWMIFVISLCFVMVLFIALGTLMETLSNEPFKNIAQLQPIIAHEASA